MATLEEFRRAVEAHDLTYTYSDDFGVYRRGPRVGVHHQGHGLHPPA